MQDPAFTVIRQFIKRVRKTVQKLQPIMLDGLKLTEPVKISGIDFSGSRTLLNNEIYNFKRAILYPAYRVYPIDKIRLLNF